MYSWILILPATMIVDRINRPVQAVTSSTDRASSEPGTRE
ncbi:hypothetical protein BH11ACT4_BH11ACT4_25420 [soil metagenome]